MTAETDAPHAAVTQRRVQLAFIDGLRAVSAVAVSVLHAFYYSGLAGEARDGLPAIYRFVVIGNFAVPTFIVLSGFVLMLPVAANPGLRFRGGVTDYVKRRARRILPPYFISLGLFFLLIAALPVLQDAKGTEWESKIPVTWQGVVSHVLLVHNLRPEWAYQINGPAWSVATEWQLYFALPFLILPVWRRFGVAVAVGSMVALSFLPAYVIGMLAPGHLWFLALFTFGAAAAWAYRTEVRVQALGYLVAAGWVASAVAVLGFYQTTQTHLWRFPAEALVGATVALTVLWLARQKSDGVSGRALRVLESRPLVWIGLWSYSLYLIHSPLLALANLLLLPLGLPVGAVFAIQLGVTLPVAMAIAYGFFLVVERRFLNGHQRSAIGTSRSQ